MEQIKIIDENYTKINILENTDHNFKQRKKIFYMNYKRAGYTDHVFELNKGVVDFLKRDKSKELISPFKLPFNEFILLPDCEIGHSFRVCDESEFFSNEKSLYLLGKENTRCL